MAATNFTPIQLYHSTTASAAPVAGNLANGELAINITDGKLFYKDNGGTVQVLATKGTGTIGGSNTQVQYNSSGALAGSSNFTFNGTTATINTLNLTNALGTTYGGTGLNSYTTGDIVYASASNTLSKLTIGTNGYILTSNGSIPTWTAGSSISVNTATNLAGGATGSVPYQSGAGATTFLSIGSANTVLTSSGTGPQWVTSLSSLTGVSSSSMTNTSLTSGRVVYSTTGGAQTDSASLTFNGTTLTAAGLASTGASTLDKLVKIGDTGFTLPSVLSATAPAKLYVSTATVTDASSAPGATNVTGTISALGSTTVAASNTGVTYTNLSTLYIAGAPTAGTNVTITNPYALYVAAGKSYFGGDVVYAGGINLNGNVTVGDSSADTLTINSTITSNLIFTDNTYDIGASGATRPRSIFLAGTVTAAGVGAFGGTALDSSFGVSATNGFKSIGDTKGLRLLNTNTDGGGFIQANAGTAGGVTVSSDAGPLTLFSGGSVALTLSPAQLATFAGNVNFNGNIGTNITFGNNAGGGETTKFIRGNAYGGAIRFAANGSTATDRGLQLGIVNNSSAFTQVVSIDGDSLFVSTRGGINSNSTALQLNNDSTTLSSNNFFTINNRGTGTTNTNNYIIGGLLFGGYRDIRNPANVATIYAERVNYASGLSSRGRLWFGTAEGQNISQDSVLPNDNYALLDENGNWLVGTSVALGRIGASNTGTGAIQMLGLNTGNGSDFGIASAGSAGQYMGTAATGDTIVRVTTNSLCIGTTSAIKFGTTTGEFGRFESGGSLLLGTTSTLNGNPRLTVSGAVSLIGGNSIYWDGTARAPTFTVAYDGSLDYLRIGSSANQGNTVGSYIDFYTGPSNNYAVRGRFQSDGSFKVFNSSFLEQDNYNIYLRYVGIAGVYAYSQKFINAEVGAGDDPGYHYVALCRAYTSGGAVNKSVFYGQVYWSRGSSSAGNNNSAVQVAVSSGYLSNETGGVNFGSYGVNIVKFTAGGIDWLGVRMSTVVSNAVATVIGFYASSQAPTLYLDGAVSSVTVLKTLPAAT